MTFRPFFFHKRDAYFLLFCATRRNVKSRMFLCFEDARSRYNLPRAIVGVALYPWFFHSEKQHYVSRSTMHLVPFLFWNDKNLRIDRDVVISSILWFRWQERESSGVVTMCSLFLATVFITFADSRSIPSENNRKSVSMHWTFLKNVIY